MPAEAGIQSLAKNWIPAFAGMSGVQLESRATVLRYRAVIPSCCACRPAETTVFPPTMTEPISALPAENT